MCAPGQSASRPPVRHGRGAPLPSAAPAAAGGGDRPWRDCLYQWRPGHREPFSKR